MIYRRPGIYSSCSYSRYSVYAGGPEVYNMTYGPGQQWTNSDVPGDLETVHDFGDGLGPVPAIPVDSASITDGINSAVLKQSGTRVSDNTSITDGINSAVLKQSGTRVSDNASITDNILSVAVIT